ncbi:MAG: type II toxin-antitoxin system RelE/ParE family toxin [Sulfurimonas sp.]|nr:type II toxin-antitoxin system RelE/ParE family toxin [Sulfurimonas sp.]
MYKIIVPKATFKELEKIDSENQKLIYSKIKDLEKGIFTSDKTLKGKHKGKFIKRVGDYRIVYLKENDILVITLIRIAHRKEVY